MIFRVYLVVEWIKTAVAGNLQHPLAMESAVVGVVLLHKVEMNLDIRRDDVRVFHVFEKLGRYLEILLMVSVGQTKQVEL